MIGSCLVPLLPRYALLCGSFGLTTLILYVSIDFQMSLLKRSALSAMRPDSGTRFQQHMVWGKSWICSHLSCCSHLGMGWWPLDCSVGLRMWSGMWTAIWLFTAFHIMVCLDVKRCCWSVFHCSSVIISVTLSCLVSTCDKSGAMSLYLLQVVDITLLMWVPHRTSLLSNWSDVSSVYSLLDVPWTIIQVSFVEI